jgi:tRNA(Arg) A34 adenosine deaminase TadA
MPPRWWNELDTPWRECVELAWESWSRGSVPVGAVIVSGDAQNVSRGRNRRLEHDAPNRQVAGTALAHAELNALLTLGYKETYGLTLYSSLRPCLLCTAAAVHCHIGLVRYAADDPVANGLERVPDLNAHLARRWPRWEGPANEPLARFSTLLVTAWAAEAQTEDPALAACQELRGVALGAGRGGEAHL